MLPLQPEVVSEYNVEIFKIGFRVSVMVHTDKMSNFNQKILIYESEYLDKILDSI